MDNFIYKDKQAYKQNSNAKFQLRSICYFQFAIECGFSFTGTISPPHGCHITTIFYNKISQSALYTKLLKLNIV